MELKKKNKPVKNLFNRMLLCIALGKQVMNNTDCQHQQQRPTTKTCK